MRKQLETETIQLLGSSALITRPLLYCKNIVKIHRNKGVPLLKRSIKKHLRNNKVNKI